MLMGPDLRNWFSGMWDNAETQENTLQNSDTENMNCEVYFHRSLPSHHLWPRKESAKQIQNWSLHRATHLNSTNSGDSPLLGTMRSHCIRESLVSWTNTCSLEPETPVRGSSPSHPVLPTCRYLFAGGHGFPALARASIPAWPCVCPGPKQRHPEVLGSLLGTSSQC